MKCIVEGCPRQATVGNKCNVHYLAATVGEEDYPTINFPASTEDYELEIEEAAHDDMQRSISDDLDTQASNDVEFGGGESGGGGAGGDF